MAGAVVVTTPEEVSLADVRKELNFCQKTKVPVLGIVENMGHLQTTLNDLKFVHPETGTDMTAGMRQLLQERCPEVFRCGVTSELFGQGGGAAAMAEAYQVPFWGRLPLDPKLLKACEQGQAFVRTSPQAQAAKALKDFCGRLVQALPVDMEK